METIFYIFYVFVYFLLTAIYGAFIIRMLMSWFAPEADNVFMRVIFFMTEIFAAPVRVFCNNRGWFQDLPIDISSTIAFLLVGLLMITMSLFL